MENFTSRYFRGQGPLFMGPQDSAGNPAGLVYAGDLETCSLSPNVSRGQTIENTSGNRAVGASYIESVTFNLSIGMRSIFRDHLALALQGGGTAMASGSITDQPHVAYVGKFIRLLHTKVSTVVVTNNTGVTTYVADTDYKVHEDQGLIEILATGSIVDASDVLIDYSYAAQSKVSSSVSNAASYLVFSGVNIADQSRKQTRCEIYKCKLDPSSLDMITQQGTGVMNLAGVVELETKRPTGDQLFSWLTED